MRHLGLRLSCIDWHFFHGESSVLAGTALSLMWGQEYNFLYKSHLEQNIHFSGCSPLHQGQSAELIQGGVKAWAVFRVSHLLGNIKRQKEPASAKTSPVYSTAAASSRPSLLCLTLHEASKALSTWRQPLSAQECSEHGTPSAQELPDILDSCKVELNHVGEEWPNLYIGNM